MAGVPLITRGIGVFDSGGFTGVPSTDWRAPASGVLVFITMGVSAFLAGVVTASTNVLSERLKRV